ncbi:MAG: phage holin family protein [Ectothiorhodospiraceae bacterium]|nr:phage holin family protein [Ectothiorhodospiraceae bacterium]
MAASETASPSPGQLSQNVNHLLDELRELAHDHLELATLETRLSINTLLRMAIIAIVTALVLVSAWLALVGSAALGLISIGLAPALAVLLLAAANLVLALTGWLWIRHMSHWLGWPATQRAIKPAAMAQTKHGAT